MKTIILSKEQIINPLKIGSIFSKKNAYIQILECIKIKITRDKMFIISYDNENAISICVDLDGNNEDISFCVNANDFIKYVKVCPDDKIILDIDDDKYIGTIKSEQYTVSFPIQDVIDFPEISKNNKITSNISLSSQILTNIINEANAFTSDDELRPVMSGINFILNDGNLKVFASNGHILYKNVFFLENNLEYFDFILNKTVFSAVTSSLLQNESVNLKISERDVTISCGETTIISRLIEGKFPNAESIIPNNNNIQCTINKNILIKAIERCLLTSGNNRLIKCSFTQSELSLASEDIDFYCQTLELIPCECNDNLVIGFNGNNFITCLKSIETEDVNILLSDAAKPSLIVPKDNLNKQIVLMPLVLND